jgi:hypothetical protein
MVRGIFWQPVQSPGPSDLSGFIKVEEKVEGEETVEGSSPPHAVLEA